MATKNQWYPHLLGPLGSVVTAAWLGLFGCASLTGSDSGGELEGQVGRDSAKWHVIADGVEARARDDGSMEYSLSSRAGLEWFWPTLEESRAGLLADYSSHPNAEKLARLGSHEDFMAAYRGAMDRLALARPDRFKQVQCNEYREVVADASRLYPGIKAHARAVYQNSGPCSGDGQVYSLTRIERGVYTDFSSCGYKVGPNVTCGPLTLSTNQYDEDCFARAYAVAINSSGHSLVVEDFEYECGEPPPCELDPECMCQIKPWICEGPTPELPSPELP